MKIVICWTDVSGYMAACWRALAARPGLDVFVITHDRSASGGSSTHADFDEQALMAGIPHRLLSESQFAEPDMIAGEVVGQRPDVVVVSGWAYPSLTALTRRRELQSVGFVMAMDTPWTGRPRQLLARWAMRWYFRRIDGVVVAGERAYRLARWIGFPESRITRGVYGIDYHALDGAFDRRRSLPSWPKKFLFVGRYVDDKGLDVLADGYSQYRARAQRPWPLTTCGQGPCRNLLAGRDGVEDLGFVQPGDMPGVFADHGAFVLASRREPWGVVLAEAAASGLPVVCTEACGGAVELVRPYYNGLVVPTEDAARLAGALEWIAARYVDLPTMGERGRWLAGAHSADIWAHRWEALLREAIHAPRRG
jgi:glycosyltransferase involved in cell wall biosynthesis